MGKTTFVTIASTFFAGLAWFFGMAFQSMAYWTPDGTISWAWFWTGVGAAYACMLLAVLLMVANHKDRKLNFLDFLVRTISFLVVAVSFLWTTFVTAMWMG